MSDVTRKGDTPGDVTQKLVATGGGGTPGGSDTQVQYNNAGAFGGVTGATTNGTTLTLTAPVLGTPASGTLTNCTGLPTAGLVDDAVTYAKMQNVSAASKLLGRGDSGAGDPQEITLGTNLSMSGTTLNAAAGGGGTTGTATLNFGAFPGASDASVAVTGQTGIVSGSIVQAWLRPEATADHSADEHRVETLRIEVGDIVAGTGFTIYGFNVNSILERDNPPHSGVRASFGAIIQFASSPPGTRYDQGGKGTRLYGQWTVAWRWS